MDSVNRLAQTVDAFCEFISRIRTDHPDIGEWGPSEVLAHLVFHHQIYVDQAEGMLFNRRHTPPRGTFAELNRRALEEYREWSTARLVRRLRELNNRLLRHYRSCDPLSVMIEIKQGAKPRSLKALVSEAEAHIRNHHRRLLRSLQGKPTRRRSPTTR